MQEKNRKELADTFHHLDDFTYDRLLGFVENCETVTGIALDEDLLYQIGRAMWHSYLIYWVDRRRAENAPADEGQGEDVG